MQSSCTEWSSWKVARPSLCMRCSQGSLCMLARGCGLSGFVHVRAVTYTVSATSATLRAISSPARARMRLVPGSLCNQDLTLGLLAYCSMYCQILTLILYDGVIVNVEMEILPCKSVLIGMVKAAMDPVETCPCTVEQSSYG